MSDGRAARFGVIVPAFNEARYLSRTLDSIRQQDFAGSVEIIVVDNKSTDGTSAIAHSYGVTTLLESRTGVCWARQAGVAASTADIIVSTDADTVHPIDWLSRLHDQFSQDESVVAVAGPCRFQRAPVWARIYPRLLFGFVQVFYRITGRVLYASATNLAFRRQAFEGYNTALTQGGDELDVLSRLRRKGRVVFDGSNVVTTSARRLNRGMAYNLVVTLLFYYALGYVVNKVAGRSLLPMAPAFRDERPRRSGRSVLVLLPLLLVGLLIWAT